MPAFTVYLAVEEPTVEVNLPLLDNPVNLSNLFSGVSSSNNLLVKPRNGRFIMDVPEETPTNDNISFEELIKREKLPVKVTSAFRGHGTKTSEGKDSNHGKLDEHGNSMAYDIVPLNGDFEGLLNLIYSNLNVVNWFKSKGWGILEETTPEIMKRTKATGKHLHIGPDPGAIKMFNLRLVKAAKGTKIPFTEYTSVEEPIVELGFPLGDVDIPWAEGLTQDEIPIVKPKNNNGRFVMDVPEETEIVSTNNVSNNDAVLFFMNKGLNKHHAVGIVANLMLESKLNPSAVNKYSGAYGIAQWLGDRKKRLFDKYGNSPTLDLQLEYIWEELNSSEKNSLDKLLNTKSYEEATNSFMNHYERPSKREMAESIHTRLKFAKALNNGERLEI